MALAVLIAARLPPSPPSGGGYNDTCQTSQNRACHGPARHSAPLHTRPRNRACGRPCRGPGRFPGPERPWLPPQLAHTSHDVRITPATFSARADGHTVDPHAQPHAPEVSVAHTNYHHVVLRRALTMNDPHLPADLLRPASAPHLCHAHSPRPTPHTIRHSLTSTLSTKNHYGCTGPSRPTNHLFSNLGSNQSRRPSPRKLNPKTIKTMSTPGGYMSHQ